MSTDSVDQLGQALDISKLHDWHPPVMTVAWWVLLHLTGGIIASMLAFQLLLLWTALTLLALYVYKISKSRGLSLLPLVFGLTPYVVNISGVIWKDNQMAFSLLLAITLLLAARHWLGNGRYKLIVYIVAALLLVYSIAVRYNSLLAIIPLLFLLDWPVRMIRYKIAIALAIIVCGLTLNLFIGVLHPVRHTNPAGSIMLDDVVHLYPIREIQEAEVSAPLRKTLISLENYCAPSEVKINYVWRCASSGDITTLFTSHYTELEHMWIRGVVNHPLKYIKYRGVVYANFLNPTPATSFVWWYGIQPNPYGVTFAPNHLTRWLQGYVDFAFSNFGFLYKPYFWLISGLFILSVALKKRRQSKHATVILALVSSGVIYIASYIPLVIGYDYRYIYWPSICISLAGILLLVDRRTSRGYQTESAALRKHVKKTAGRKTSKPKS